MARICIEIVKHDTPVEHARWVILSVTQTESIFAGANLQDVLKVAPLFANWRGWARCRSPLNIFPRSVRASDKRRILPSTAVLCY